jgi:hypothetical protein
VKEENRAVGRPRTGILSDGNPGPVEEATIPDYVMLDFADDFFPEEAANSSLRKPHAPPDLFG